MGAADATALALAETAGRGVSLTVVDAAGTAALAPALDEALSPDKSTLGGADAGATRGLDVAGEATPLSTSLVALLGAAIGCSLEEPMPQTTKAPEQTSAPNPIGTVYFERRAWLGPGRSARAGASNVGVSAIGFTD